MITKLAVLTKLAYSQEIIALMKKDPKVRKLLVENQRNGNLENFLKDFAKLGYKPEQFGFSKDGGGKWTASNTGRNSSSNSYSRSSSGTSSGTSSGSSRGTSGSSNFSGFNSQDRSKEWLKAKIRTKHFANRMNRHSKLINQGFGTFLASTLAAPFISSLYKSKENKKKYKSLPEYAKNRVTADYPGQRPSKTELEDYATSTPTIVGGIAGGMAGYGGFLKHVDNLSNLGKSPRNKDIIRKAYRSRFSPLIGVPSALLGAEFGTRMMNKNFEDAKKAPPKSYYQQ